MYLAANIEGRIGALEAELAQKQRALEVKNVELRAMARELAVWKQRCAQLEAGRKCG